MTKNAFLRPKKAKIEKSEESGPKLFFDFTYKYVPSSHNLGVMWRGNQKRKSGGNFLGPIGRSVCKSVTILN